MHNFTKRYYMDEDEQLPLGHYLNQKVDNSDKNKGNNNTTSTVLIKCPPVENNGAKKPL